MRLLLLLHQVRFCCFCGLSSAAPSSVLVPFPFILQLFLFFLSFFVVVRFCCSVLLSLEAHIFFLRFFVSHSSLFFTFRCCLLFFVVHFFPSLFYLMSLFRLLSSSSLWPIRSFIIAASDLFILLLLLTCGFPLSCSSSSCSCKPCSSSSCDGRNQPRCIAAHP